MEKPVNTLNKSNCHLVVADTQFLIRVALKELLKLKFSTVHVFETREDLNSFLQDGSVDLLILDYKLYDFDDISEIEHLKNKFPQVNILILSDGLNQADMKELNAAGIKNFLLKTTDETELFRAIECTMAGKNYYSDELLDLILDTKKKIHPDTVFSLTMAEMEIVRLIAEGLTAKEIATNKYISFHTVMSHRKNIFRKLGVTNASELIMFAIRKGWIDNIEYYI